MSGAAIGGVIASAGLSVGAHFGLMAALLAVVTIAVLPSLLEGPPPPPGEPASRLRISPALVGLGVLRPVELYREISSQVRAKYLEAFRWRTGEWAYVPDARAQEDTYPIGKD